MSEKLQSTEQQYPKIQNWEEFETFFFQFTHREEFVQITLAGREFLFGFEHNGAYFMEPLDEEFLGEKFDVFYGTPVEILAQLKSLYTGEPVKNIGF